MFLRLFLISLLSQQQKKRLLNQLFQLLVFIKNNFSLAITFYFIFIAIIKKGIACLEGSAHIEDIEDYVLSVFSLLF